MFKMNRIMGRYKRFFAAEKRIDTLLIMNTGSQDPNFYYLTGFKSSLFEKNILLISKNHAYLFTYDLEYQDAVRQKFPGMEVVRMGNTVRAMTLLLKEIKGKRIGINGEFLPFNYYEKLSKAYKPKTMIDVSESLANARLIKDKNEIENIRKAAKITKTAHRLIQKHFKVGITEIGLAKKFDEISAELGSEGPSFETIVCFGSNAALPHHSPDNTKLKKGDIILIDAGAKANRYCSDITRSSLFGRKSVEDYRKKKEMYDTVKEAHDLALKSIREGVPLSRVHFIAADYINKKDNGKYDGKFIHSLGHSLGIEVHDGPGFSPAYSNIKAKAGMVITDEPGIYIKGFGGIRIEDDVLVTEKGAVIL